MKLLDGKLRDGASFWGENGNTQLLKNSFSQSWGLYKTVKYKWFMDM